MNKILIFIIVIGILAGLIWYFYAGNSSPNQTSQLAKIDIQKNFKASPDLESQQNIPVTIPEAIQLPAQTSAAAYSYNRKYFVNDQNIDKLITTYKLDSIKKHNDAFQGEVGFASNAEYTLVIEKNRNTLTLAKNLIKPVGDISFHTPEEYQERAREFLTTLGIDLKYYTSLKYSYMNLANSKGEFDSAIVNNATDADMIELLYEAELNEIPIIDKQMKTDGNIISVLMDSSFNVQKIFIESVGEITNQTSVAKLKTAAQIITAVQQGEAKIITSDMTADQKLKSININNVRLAYFPIENQLTPVFVLTGKATFEVDSLFSEKIQNPVATLLLDAIDRSNQQ